MLYNFPPTLFPANETRYCYELDAALVAARAEMVNSFTPEKAAAATAQATASGKSAESSLKTGFCEIYDLGGDGVANYSSRVRLSSTVTSPNHTLACVSCIPVSRAASWRVCFLFWNSCTHVCKRCSRSFSRNM